MQRSVLVLAFFVVMSCCAFGAELELSSAERAWIAEHPTVIVGAETDWPPYDYVVNGRAVGFSNDYLRLLAAKAGLKLTFVHGYSWAQLLQKMAAREIDILPAISATAERRTFMAFVDPYLMNLEGLFIHRNIEGVRSLEDMDARGLTLACIAGFSINKTIKKRYPGIKCKTFATPLESLMAVNEGVVDGYVDYIAVVNYIRRENFLANLRIASTNVLGDATPLNIGVRKDWPLLVQILAKAAQTVAPNEFEELKSRWLSVEGLHAKEFWLSDAEKSYLAELGTLRVGVSDSWVPIKFTDAEGTLQGITAEYLKIIGAKLGVQFEVRSGAWRDIVNQTREGAIDILPILNETPQRREFLHFSKPYVRIPLVIATHINTSYYADVDDVEGVVGVGEGFAIQEKLRGDYPNLALRGYKTIEAAVQGLDDGEVAALVANGAVFSYLVNKLDLEGHLHINNTAGYEDVLAVGVRKDLQPLVPLLNRVLENISPAEHELIMDKWSNLPFQKRADWEVVWQIVGAALLLFVLVFIWGSKMAIEVRRRRSAEERLLNSDKRFEMVFSKVSDTVLVWGRDEACMYANPSALNYFKTDRQRAYGKNFVDIIPAEKHFIELWMPRIHTVFEEGATQYYRDEVEFFGKTVHSRAILSPLINDLGVIYAVSFVYRDATAEVEAQRKIGDYAQTQEVLLREVNHRVANNLTALLSMIHMENDKLNELDCSGYCETRLKAMEKRISCLAIVHSMLSASRWKPLAVSELCERVIRKSIEGHLQGAEFDLAIAENSIYLGSEESHSLVLVLNELGVNSAKYAAVAGQVLRVDISFAGDDEEIELLYRDNGPGFPDGILDERVKSGGLGMGILRGVVVSSLGGSLHCFNDKGACARIAFPVSRDTKDEL